jgi:hypothetical protein
MRENFFRNFRGKNKTPKVPRMAKTNAAKIFNLSIIDFVKYFWME